MEERTEEFLMEFDTKIEAFLKKEMSPEQESEFKATLAQDEELKQRAQAMAYLIKNIRAERDRKIIESTREPIAWYRHKFIQMAAMLIICLSCGLLLFHNHRVGQAQDLAQKYYSSELMAAYSRGDSDNDDIEKEITQLSYRVLSNDESVVTKLAELYEISKQSVYNDYTNYYNSLGMNLAMAYLYRNKPNKAKEVLLEIIENNPNKVISADAQKIIDEIDNL
ncbi:MAG: hypothetical protein MJZ15_04630 [Bacteroidales bacterium]|nr:hypothetical protein [Bacteroidales bacterium]